MILSRDDIQTIIPHREPFIFVDEVNEIEPGTRAEGVAWDFLSYPLFGDLAGIGSGSSYFVNAVVPQDGGYTAHVPSVRAFAKLFEGHFPGHLVFPGVLTLEAVAETAAMVVEERWADSDASAFLSAVDRWRFRSPVWPDDSLTLRVERLAEDRDLVRFSGEAYVDDRLAAQGELSFSRYSATREIAETSPGLNFPISMLIEALAEVGAVLALNNDGNKGKIIFLAGVENWRTYKPIQRGCEIRMEAVLVAKRQAYGKGHVVAVQGGCPVAEGDLMFVLREPSQDEPTGRDAAARAV